MLRVRHRLLRLVPSSIFQTMIDLHNYDSFIAAKSRSVGDVGFDPMPITAPLFPFQRHVVEWAIRKGRASMFEECGLGKTLQQLEWASQVAVHTGGAMIVLTPLAVASQTLAESERSTQIVNKLDESVSNFCYAVSFT